MNTTFLGRYWKCAVFLSLAVLFLGTAASAEASQFTGKKLESACLYGTFGTGTYTECGTGRNETVKVSGSKVLSVPITLNSDSLGFKVYDKNVIKTKSYEENTGSVINVRFAGINGGFQIARYLVSQKDLVLAGGDIGKEWTISRFGSGDNGGWELIFGAPTEDKSKVIFPIKELGSCADQASCKTYCGVTANMTACLDYAQSHNLMKPDEIAQARKMTQIAVTGGPGGCKDKDSCAAYCENSTDHLNECVAFAEKTGLVSGDALKEMQNIQSALKAGGQLPGGCKNKNDCQSYCSASAHMEECIGFAEKSGMLKGKDLEDAKKVMPLIASGQAPGGCTTKEQCQTYCADSSRAIECVSFAEKAGLISKEEADIARKTGGKGPNSCTSKESCDAFCNQKANQQSCLSFAKEHDLIPAEQLKQIEEGTARLRMGLSQFPEEIAQCLKDKVGPDTVGEIESGNFVPNQEFGETIQGCFDAFKPKMQAKIQEGLKYATPEVTGCLETALGADGFQKMKQGDINSPEEGDKVKVCFEKMKDQAKEQMQKGAEQMNQIPAEARDCVKQKLGSDIFEKIQSGDPEQMKDANPGNIQSAIMSCVSQSIKSSIPGGGQSGGPSQEQIQEMMKSGAPPSQEQIQQMIQKSMPSGIPQMPGGAPSNVPGAPTQEQIQQMIQKNMPSGIPQMPNGMTPPSGFPTPTYP